MQRDNELVSNEKRQLQARRVSFSAKGYRGCLCETHIANNPAGIVYKSVYIPLAWGSTIERGMLSFARKASREANKSGLRRGPMCSKRSASDLPS